VEEDPFDIYDSFSKFCESNSIPLVYFFLFSNKGKYDRTVNPQSKVFKQTFNRIKKHNALIGLHPGYSSKDADLSFSSEVKKFENQLGEPLKFSRQHYLKFDVKSTPALLLKNGIVADFSMGFASSAGFRAGTSEAFYHFDLKNNSATELLIVPFCAMDGAYFIYDNLSAEKAFIELDKLKQELKKMNGLFLTVFHERTFAEHLYPGFGDMYKKLLKD
jgi:hypothetical protein